jgi:hypothetical protein
MPLDNYFTKPDYSRQLKQYSGTSAIFSGTTNILQAFYVKSVEIDTAGAVLSDALLFDGIKFRPGQPGGFSGSVITNGFNLSYVSGLTYRVSPGSYRFNNTIYAYTGQDFDILPGQSGGSRFDLVFISGGTVNISVRTGTTTTNPTVPNLQVGELEVGIISVPVGFTGGTGSTIIQTSGESVFVYYNNGAGTGIQRAAAGSNTQAPGTFSFAVGRDSDAYAPDSVTLGVDTKASGNSQTVVGTFNIPTTTDYFIVGYGANDSNRANAFNITNSGDTYANRKLFVTNVEIETTGATNGQVLKYDGTKFKPQLETITGVTSFTGGTSIFSSITNNTLLFKSITGGSNVFLTESGGTIYVNVELSGVTLSGLTEIQSLTGGVSIISGKTGSTYFLYPLQGSGGTQVVLSNNKLVIYSDTSASTTGDNVGPIAAAGVYKEKVLNQLRFRRLSSSTPSFLSIAESTGLNELILFTSTPPITGSTNATGSSIGVLASVSNKNIVGRALTGTNRASVTQALDLITINSPIEVQNGDIGTLSIYRSSSPIVYSSYTATSITGITVKLGTHAIPITSRTYTIPDVRRNANFVMTEGNQTINGKKDFTSGFTVGYNGNTSLDFTSYDYSTPGTSPNSYYFYAPKDPLYSLLIDYSTSALTSQNINLNVSYTGTTFFGIDITTYTASTGTSYNSPISWTLYDDCSCDSIDYYYTGDSFNMVVSGYDQTLQTSTISYTSYTYSANTVISNSIGNILFNNAWAGLPGPLLRAKSLLIEGVSPVQFPISAFTVDSGITILKTTNIGPPIIRQGGAYSGSIIGNLTRISYNGNNNISDPINYLTGTFVGESQQNSLASSRDSRLKMIGTYLENYAANAFVANSYDTVKTLAFGYRSNVVAGVFSRSIFDIYIYKPLVGPGYNPTQTTNSAAIYIEGKKIPYANSRENDLYNRPTSTSNLGITYTNAPWSLFAEGDRAYIGNTLVLATGITLSSTTRGAWIDIGNSTTTRPQINFASGGTAPTTPRVGDLWFDGTVLKFRLSSSTVNLTSGTSITGGSIGSSLGGGVDIYKTTIGDTLQFRSISSSNSSYISITQVGDLIVFSGGPGVTGLSLNDLIFTSQTTNGVSLFNTIQPYQIYYKNLSAGTGIGITDNGSGLITIRNTITGGTSGGSISGAYVSGLTPVGTGGFVILSSVTNNNLVHRTISAGTNTNISYGPDGTLVITNTGISGNTSYTGFTDIVSAGTGDYSVISSVTNNKLVYRTISAGTGMNITESNGTLTFNSTATGTTGSGGTLSGDYLPLSGGTLTGGLSAITISATSIDRLNYIDFNTGATQSPAFGRVYFDGTEQALTYYGQGTIPVRLGQQLYSRVINSSGALIPKGSVVKITGATSGLPAITLAIAEKTGDNSVVGLAADNIANGATGLIINNGLISGLTINNFSVGDLIYLSPVSAGTYVNDLSPYGFDIRTNVVGRVVATGTTTGQIYVKTDNEDPILSLTSIERNILEGNVISTGTYEYTGLTTGSTNTTFNVAPLRGWIVKNTYEYATLPDVINVYYTGGTNISVTNIATADATYLLINSADTLYQQTTFPTPQQRRQNIFIGKVVHPNRSTILALNNTVDYDVSPISSLRDLWTPIKLINDGIIPSANTGLTFQTSLGKLFGNGIGWATNQLNPNSIDIPAKAPASFFYRTRTGGTSSAVTNIDPTKYDLNGVITSVGGAGSDDSTNQRIYLYPTGVINVLYGQTIYNNLAAAVAGIQSESFVTYSNASSTGILIGILSVRNDAAPTGDDEPLSNSAYAVFTPVSKFGELLGGTGGLSTTTLQQAYDNSSQPEITINSTLDGLSIKNGTGSANTVTKLLEGIDSTNVTTSFIRADGTISGLTFLGDASNLTGVLSKTNLSTTLTISSTTKTVPLNTFYLYDKITLSAITSTETVTAITSNVSISSYTPSIKFFAQTGVTVTFRNSATLKTEGGLDAVIVGSNYDSITFTYNNDIQKYFQTNINNYI